MHVPDPIWPSPVIFFGLLLSCLYLSYPLYPITPCAASCPCQHSCCIKLWKLWPYQQFWLIQQEWQDAASSCRSSCRSSRCYTTVITVRCIAGWVCRIIHHPFVTTTLPRAASHIHQFSDVSRHCLLTSFAVVTAVQLSRARYQSPWHVYSY